MVLFIINAGSSFRIIVFQFGISFCNSYVSQYCIKDAINQIILYHAFKISTLLIIYKKEKKVFIIFLLILSIKNVS
jgi:hypothetical protein